MTEKLKNPFKINELIIAVNELDTDKQDTLVSGTNIKTINGSSILGSGNVNVESGANTSLSNITMQGQNIANWSTNVTNCITEIPQDIKLELNNGTLTLKSRSVITALDGSQYQTTVDRTYTASGSETKTGLLFVEYGSGVIQGITSFSKISSGSSLPVSPNNYDVFYNTTDNRIYIYYSSGTWNAWSVALPIAICTQINGVITFIDQVFNGFGYIGSTVFVLPGVKGLISNGRNEDGTLKNIEFTINSVLTSTQEITGWNGKWSLYLNASSIQYHPTELEYISDTKPTGVYTTTAYWYSPLDNKLYFTQDTGATWTQFDELHCVDYTENSSKITSITPKIVFRIADDNTVIHKTGDETICGDKTFVNTVIHKNTKATINNPPSIESFVFTDYIDNDNNRIGIIGSRINSDGVRGTYLQAGNENQLAILTNGTDTWTWSPTSDKNHSVVTTEAILKANNDTMYNYVKFGNGLLIQWGHIQQNSQQLNVTFPIPFMNTAYRMFTQDAGQAAGYSYAGVTGIGRTTTGATLYSYYANRYYDWLAIGFWY